MSQSVAAIAAAAGGFAASARAQANSVTGTPNRVKIRWSRHHPTRAPYSNMLSAARSRRLPASVLALSMRPVSETPSPAGWESSEPSSKLITKLTAMRAPPGQRGFGGKSGGVIAFAIFEQTGLGDRSGACVEARQFDFGIPPQCRRQLVLQRC